MHWFLAQIDTSQLLQPELSAAYRSPLWFIFVSAKSMSHRRAVLRCFVQHSSAQYTFLSLFNLHMLWLL